MAKMPEGKAFRDYNEIRMLITAYAKRLSENRDAYEDVLIMVNRLAALGREARRLWNDD